MNLALSSRAHVASVLCLASVAAAASAADQPAPSEPPATVVDGPAKPAPAASPTVWEGAIGLTTSYRPEYQGADKARFKVTPALFLRYGRLTITNASGFVTRRADDVARGLALDLVQAERLRVNAALRVDAGRSESTSSELAGMGDIRATIRLRVNASYKLEGPWRLGGAWAVDALGRGGGYYADGGIAWEQRVDPQTVVTVGASLSVAGDRYMQTYYGVDEAQAQRSGYPVYYPGSGLRDLAFNANLRHDIGRDWIVLAGAGASRLMGTAAASPLTHSRYGWGVNAGLAWRF